MKRKLFWYHFTIQSEGLCVSRFLVSKIFFGKIQKNHAEGENFSVLKNLFLFETTRFTILLNFLLSITLVYWICIKSLILNFILFYHHFYGLRQLKVIIHNNKKQFVGNCKNVKRYNFKISLSLFFLLINLDRIKQKVCWTNVVSSKCYL
jgi:hypothetical protein